MISIICSSVLIFLIVTSSVLIAVLYEINTALPTKAALGTAQAISKNKVATDKFGITEIYPTKPNGGWEWYINMSSPLNDNPSFQVEAI